MGMRDDGYLECESMMERFRTFLKEIEWKVEVLIDNSINLNNLFLIWKFLLLCLRCCRKNLSRLKKNIYSLFFNHLFKWN